MGARSSWSNFCIKNLEYHSKSGQMDSTWLDMGPYSVRMKRTASRKLSKCLPDYWDTIKIQTNQWIPGKFRKFLGIYKIHTAVWYTLVMEVLTLRPLINFDWIFDFSNSLFILGPPPCTTTIDKPNLFNMVILSLHCVMIIVWCYFIFGRC